MKGSVFLASLGVAGAGVLVGQLAGAPGTGTSSVDPDGLILNNGGGATLGQDVYDVHPCRVRDLTQFGSMGNYPDGTVGLALATTGQNVGNVQLPWYRSPDVDHPIIAQNVYRINADGRIEQIGLSWLKHAWYAV